MHAIKAHRITLAFWGFIIMLMAAISTALFSESHFNDQFAYSTMPLALLGIVLSAAFLAVDALFEICNS